MLIDIINLEPQHIKGAIKPNYYEVYKIGYTVGLMTSNDYENPYSKRSDDDSIKTYWSGFYDGRKKRGSQWV